MAEQVAKATPFTPYPLRGLLFCQCGQPCHPMDSIDGSRAYASLCGCRLSPLSADTVERLVLDAAEREAPALLANLSVGRRVEAIAKVFSEITVGGTADDMSFVPRT